MPANCYLDRWRQGSCLPLSLHGSVILPSECPPLEEGDRLLVISQDCDILHKLQDPAKREDPALRLSAFEDEPYVEVMVARPRETKPLFERGRSPRRLQIDIGTADGGLVRFELHQRDKGLIPRKLLSGAQPDEAMVPLRHGDPPLQILRAWLAKRYTRPAFPTTLDMRLSKASNKLKDKLKGDAGRAITAIFLLPHTFEELPPERPYALIVRVVTEDAGSEAARRAANAVTDALRVPGIKLLDNPPDLVSENEFSYAESLRMLPWDFDYLSALE